MTMPDWVPADNVGAPLPTCFTQYRPDLSHPPITVWSTSTLNWADLTSAHAALLQAVQVNDSPARTARLGRCGPEGPGRQ